jgi:DNA-binding MarR family transcriptional regulator
MPPADTETVHRDGSEDAILLGVLDAVERDPAVTQRSVARELNIALGLANAYLRRCIRKGLIKVSQVPRRRYAYYLTPQGFAEKTRLTASYLSISFSFFRKAREQCGALFEAAAKRGHKRLALLGDGDLAEIATLVARDFAVEIATVIPAASEAEVLHSALGKVGRVDGIVVTAVVDPRGAFEAAVAVFGSERVYAPALLRLPFASVEGDQARSAS